jgi:hypothetical protein
MVFSIRFLQLSTIRRRRQILKIKLARTINERKGRAGITPHGSIIPILLPTYQRPAAIAVGRYGDLWELRGKTSKTK